MASPDRPRAGARRIADVALRHLAPGGRARVHWPAPCADPTVAPLVVLFSTDDDLIDELIARLAAVVLRVSLLDRYVGALRRCDVTAVMDLAAADAAGGRRALAC